MAREPVRRNLAQPKMGLQRRVLLLVLRHIHYKVHTPGERHDRIYASFVCKWTGRTNRPDVLKCGHFSATLDHQNMH